jgi:hypothetical protein
MDDGMPLSPLPGGLWVAHEVGPKTKCVSGFLEHSAVLLKICLVLNTWKLAVHVERLLTNSRRTRPDTEAHRNSPVSTNPLVTPSCFNQADEREKRKQEGLCVRDLQGQSLRNTSKSKLSQELRIS